MLSISEIRQLFQAKQLGVSKTTVHYALRNTDRVSESTRLRVLAKAKEMDYRPNLVARSLRSQRSATLGVIVIDLTSSYEGTSGIKVSG